MFSLRGVRAGVAIACVLLPFVSALVHQTAPSESPAHARRYAITGAWFPKEKSADDPAVTDTSRLACPLVLSLTGGAAAARGALPAGQRGAPIDRVLFTQKSELGEEAVAFLEARGIVVKDINSDPTMQEVDKHMPRAESLEEAKRPARTSGFGPTVNLLKLPYLWETQYDAVLQLDQDIFFDGPARVDMLGAVARGSQTMFTFEGATTLVAGGILAVRPSGDFEAGFKRAMRHGYRLEDGYGGKYPEELSNITRGKHQAFCKQFGWTNPCCKDNSAPTTWCFGGAHTDQGLLLSLALDGGRDRRVPHAGAGWGSVGAWQANCSPKPWQMDKLDELQKKGRMRLVRRFWWWYGRRGRKLLGEDAECTAFYEGEHRVFRRWGSRHPLSSLGAYFGLG